VEIEGGEPRLQCLVESAVAQRTQAPAMIVRVRERRHGEKIIPHALPRHPFDRGYHTTAYANAHGMNGAIAIRENRAADDDFGNMLLHAMASVTSGRATAIRQISSSEIMPPSFRSTVPRLSLGARVGGTQGLRDQKDRRLTEVSRLLVKEFDHHKAQFARTDCRQANGSLGLESVGNSLDVAKANAQLQRVRALASRQELGAAEKKSGRWPGDASSEKYRGRSNPYAGFSSRAPLEFVARSVILRWGP
jgi:hypothetical protein